MAVPKPHVKAPARQLISTLSTRAPSVKQLDDVHGSKFGVREVDVKGAVSDTVDAAALLAESETGREPLRDERLDTAVAQAAVPSLAAQSGFDPAPLIVMTGLSLFVAVIVAYALRRDAMIRRIQAVL
jgi:hypothetical protein